MKNQDKIEAYLKKAGFFKLTGKDVWAAGKVPHQKIVDLSVEPPWVGISTGTQRQEAEECGIAQVQDIKVAVLDYYNAVQKPADQVKSLAETPPLQEEPPKSDNPLTAKPESAGKSHPFICSACHAGISAEQRASSFKDFKKALCENCSMTEGRYRDLEKLNDEPKPEPVKEPKKENEKKKPMVKEEPKTNMPAVQEKAKSPTLSDADLDAKIEKAKTRRYLAGQGGSYKVSGKERPDSASIQNAANDEGVSTEILVAEQTEKYAHVIVRAHLRNHFVDAAVHHDFSVEFQLKTMEIIEKNPEILDHYEGTIPVIKEGASILKKTDRGDERIDAKYYLVHALLSFQKFSLRDAVTKAMSAAQAKMLNQDAREPEEIASEQAERDLVEKNKRR